MSPESQHTIEINHQARFAKVREVLGIQAVTMPEGVPRDLKPLFRRITRGKPISILHSAEMAPINPQMVAHLLPAVSAEGQIQEVI